MPYLSWIKDEDLVFAVDNLISKASSILKEAESTFNNNVVDPFSALFEVTGFGLTYDAWVTSEKTRKSQKSLQNHVGDFHQRILGKVDGWEDLDTGKIADLVSTKKMIVAEIKNKFNTVKGNHLSGVYRDIESLVLSKNSVYHDYTGYYVTVIPKRPKRFNIPFSPSDNKIGQRLPANEKIRQIDGASFYELVTGERDALKSLFECLPQVIADSNKINLTDDEKRKLSHLFGLAFG